MSILDAAAVAGRRRTGRFLRAFPRVLVMSALLLGAPLPTVHAQTATDTYGYDPTGYGSSYPTDPSSGYGSTYGSSSAASPYGAPSSPVGGYGSPVNGGTTGTAVLPAGSTIPDQQYQPSDLQNGTMQPPSVAPSFDARAVQPVTAAPNDPNSAYSPRAVAPGLFPPRPHAVPGEFERYVAHTLGRPLPRFGSSLFLDDARGFAPSATASVPPDYTLNPGDELVVGLAGSINATDLRLVIDNEGRIFVPRVGAINLTGVRYGEIEQLLARRLGQQYRNFKVSVRIGRLHGVRVYVTGYAVSPGAYTVSSLSTLVNAVIAAGGPTSAGSFRNIELRRNGQVITHFDLYDLLLNGDRTHDAVLQNEDVIFVGPVGPQVAVTGSVNAEAIYEVKPDETLKDVLRFAGGLNSVADWSRVIVSKLSDLDAAGSEEVNITATPDAKVERGEIVRVLSSVDVPRPQERQAVLVTIGGEVEHPGRYYLQPGSTLGDLISKAGGLTSKAFVFGTELDRVSIREQQRANFDQALRQFELSLAAQPALTVHSSEDATATQAAHLQAARDVLAELRAQPPSGRLVLGLAPDAHELPADVVLENNDKIEIPPPPASVGVFGAIYQSGSFMYQSRKTIGDYLKQAGGPEELADRDQIFVVRANGSVVSAREDRFGHHLLSEPALPGDVIFVPIATNRGMGWERFKDLSTALFQFGLSAAALKVLTN